MLARYDSDQGFKVWMDASGDMCFGIDDDATWGPDDQACTSGVDYDDNVWHHFTAYKNSASAIYLYIDGAFVASDVSLAATATLTSNSALLYIGSDGPTLGSYWKGLIDDVRIYNYARTPDEIRLDYNAGFAAHFGPKSSCDDDPGSCMTEGLVGYWNFEEGSGGMAYDATDNSNDGTLTYMSTSTNSWAGGIVPLSGGKTGGTALQFDGTDDYVDVGDIGSVQTVEFWLNDSNATDGVLELVNNTNYISISSSAISLTSFTNSITYINGLATTTLASGWNHVVVTADAISAASFKIGEANSDYTDGLIDEVRIYNRALSATEVRHHYNRGGPVGHWKFDEGSGTTAYDSTENDNDGTLTYMSTSTQGGWVSGKYGTALSFDGTDDYVASGSNITGVSSFTHSLWFKSSDGTFSADEYLFSQGTNDPSVYLESTDNKLKVMADAVDNLSSNSTVNDTKWHHLEVTADGSNIKLYLDGILEDSASYTGSSATGVLNIAANATPASYFDGLIDDVRIYNYARTPSQILQDYNAGLGMHFK